MNTCMKTGEKHYEFDFDFDETAFNKRCEEIRNADVKIEFQIEGDVSDVGKAPGLGGVVMPEFQITYPEDMTPKDDKKAEGEKGNNDKASKRNEEYKNLDKQYFDSKT